MTVKSHFQFIKWYIHVSNKLSTSCYVYLRGLVFPRLYFRKYGKYKLRNHLTRRRMRFARLQTVCQIEMGKQDTWHMSGNLIQNSELIPGNRLFGYCCIFHAVLNKRACVTKDVRLLSQI